jgi:NAD+ synthase
MAFITDPAAVSRQISDWIRDTLRSTDRFELVLGLSGGIDSALAAYLAVGAIGPERVICIKLPNHTSSTESITDADKVADALGLKTRQVEISPMAKAFEGQITDLDLVRRGNLCARLRMIVLFDQSHANGLVLGTSNKTEALLGYGTIHGDAAWSMNPLADLYKTDVRLLSRYLGIPQEIIDKTPTADLWPGQTDEHELGFSYSAIDKALVALVDEKKTRDQAIAAGEDVALVDRVLELIRRFKFKRQPAYRCWLNEPYSTVHLES